MIGATEKQNRSGYIYEHINNLDDALLHYQSQVIQYRTFSVRALKRGDYIEAISNEGCADGYQMAHDMFCSCPFNKAVKKIEEDAIHYSELGRNEEGSSEEQCSWYQSVSNSLNHALKEMAQSEFYHRIRFSLPSEGDEIFLRSVVFLEDLERVFEELKLSANAKCYETYPLLALKRNLSSRSVELASLFNSFCEHQKNRTSSERKGGV